jgi:hypothetical protein
MPKTIARKDHRVLVTIGYLEKYPNMGVLDATNGKDNDDNEGNDDSKANITKQSTGIGSGRNGGDDGDGDGDSDNDIRQGQ